LRGIEVQDEIQNERLRYRRSARTVETTSAARVRVPSRQTPTRARPRAWRVKVSMGTCRATPVPARLECP